MAVFLLFAVVGGLATVIFFGVGYYLSPQDALAKADAVVAISGGHTETRTAEAVKLYRDGWATHVIFSGAAADPSGPSNAQAMAAAASLAGVPDAAISLDEAAANTRQNASGVGEIVKQQKYRSIILVTSPYHQRRAEIAFRRVLGKDFTIISHSSFDADWRRSHWWATAQSRALTFAELQKVAYELASGQAK